MTDIVEQLRHRADWDVIAFSSFDPQMCIDAADEIERLRALITEWADALDDTSHQSYERAVSAGDALRQAVGR